MPDWSPRLNAAQSWGGGSAPVASSAARRGEADKSNTNIPPTANVLARLNVSESHHRPTTFSRPLALRNALRFGFAELCLGLCPSPPFSPTLHKKHFWG